MEEFYTINQAAISLKVHPLTVRRYVKEGKLKAFRMGGNIRISLNDLRQFAQNFISRPKQNEQALSSRNKATPATQTKPFSFSDPLFSLKAKGLSISKIEQE